MALAAVSAVFGSGRGSIVLAFGWVVLLMSVELDVCSAVLGTGSVELSVGPM